MVVSICPIHTRPSAPYLRDAASSPIASPIEFQIDIEGHEHEALGTQGAGGFFRKHSIAFLLTESWPNHLARKRFFRYLASELNYTLHVSKPNAAQAQYQSGPFGAPFDGRHPPEAVLADTRIFDVLGERSSRA